MPTRRKLLAAAALAPILAYLPAQAQGEDPAGTPAATPVATPQPGTLPDLRDAQPLPFTGKRLATFEAYVAAKLEELSVPGAAVAVIQDGDVAFLQGFGVRESGRPEPVTADTLLRIGSVTKSFSSLLAAKIDQPDRIQPPSAIPFTSHAGDSIAPPP